MASSGYQVQRLIARLRHWLGVGAEAAAPADPVRMSPAALREAELGGKAARARAPAGLWERPERPPAVERELERRAGSFMRPPFPDPPTRSPIAKMRKPAEDGEVPADGREEAAEGDSNQGD